MSHNILHVVRIYTNYDKYLKQRIFIGHTTVLMYIYKVTDSEFDMNSI